ALLFEGIQSMFGQHAGGILSGSSAQPGISETVINNYYGSDQAPPGTQTTAWDQPNDPSIVPADYAADAPPVPGLDYASDSEPDAGQDFASDQDFGGGNDDLV